MAVVHCKGMNGEYIATFFTHYGASQFARRLRQDGIRHRMMPVPRSLSSSCGTCVRFWVEDVQAYIQGEDLEGVYGVEGSHYLPIVVYE